MTLKLKLTIVVLVLALLACEGTVVKKVDPSVTSTHVPAAIQRLDGTPSTGECVKECK